MKPILILALTAATILLLWIVGEGIFSLLNEASTILFTFGIVGGILILAGIISGYVYLLLEILGTYHIKEEEEKKQ